MLHHVVWTLIIQPHKHITVCASQEVCWEVGGREGGDLTAHVHSAYSYSKHIVLQ
jgi:hypothetical protein